MTQIEYVGKTAFTSKGITFTPGGYPVADDVADYLVSTFPSVFKIVQSAKPAAQKEEIKVEANPVETKAEPKSTKNK